MYFYPTTISKSVKDNQPKILASLFESWAGEQPVFSYLLPGSGSNRKYYRLTGKIRNAIGVIGEDHDENKAYLTFTSHFRKHGLRVPEIYLADEINGIYLIQDLGDESLFSLVSKRNKDSGITEEIKELYKQSLDELIKFQVVAGKDLDYSVCFPRSDFDSQSMQWDLNYFKYYYLKLFNISFNEQSLEDDFQELIRFLSDAPHNYFMYRDFQSRNILIFNNQPWFIDFQGGRRGPLQYDIASLLFQARAGLPHEFRAEMRNYYIQKVSRLVTIDQNAFEQFYYGFVLIRMLQVMGAYGYRGLIEKKQHFLESIEFVTENIKWFVQAVNLPVGLPELFSCFRNMLNIK